MTRAGISNDFHSGSQVGLRPNIHEITYECFTLVDEAHRHLSQCWSALSYLHHDTGPLFALQYMRQCRAVNGRVPSCHAPCQVEEEHLRIAFANPFHLISLLKMQL